MQCIMFRHMLSKERHTVHVFSGSPISVAGKWYSTFRLQWKLLVGGAPSNRRMPFLHMTWLCIHTVVHNLIYAQLSLTGKCPCNNCPGIYSARVLDCHLKRARIWLNATVGYGTCIIQAYSGLSVYPVCNNCLRITVIISSIQLTDIIITTGGVFSYVKLAGIGFCMQSVCVYVWGGGYVGATVATQQV